MRQEEGQKVAGVPTMTELLQELMRGEMHRESCREESTHSLNLKQNQALVHVPTPGDPDQQLN